jgi:hypothetical protein
MATMLKIPTIKMEFVVSYKQYTNQNKEVHSTPSK